MSGHPLRRHAFVLLLVALAVLSVVACSSIADTPTIDKPSAQSPAEPVEGSQAEDDAEVEREGEFTTLEAVSLALELYPDSAVVEIERDHEKGGEVWEIVIRHQDARGTELHIDVQTGDVLKERPARVPSEVRAAPPRISIEEAIAIALETVPGAISEMEIETQGGRVVWEAEGASSSGRMFVHIDAHSGEVIAQGVGN